MNVAFLGVFRHAAIVAGKDLQSELRTKESFNAALAFSATILILFSFAIDPFSETLREMSGGLLWLVFAFAGALVLNRSFAREQANDCLDVLLASPASGAAAHVNSNTSGLKTSSCRRAASTARRCWNCPNCKW